jgi:hypothetical protein
MLLAAHAAIAMKGSAAESTSDSTRETLSGKAKASSWNASKINALEAFDLLVLASQRTHNKLRDVADELAATGELTTD